MSLQFDGMEAAANAVAEEILQAIYGDDLAGCQVPLDTIAAIVGQGIQSTREVDLEMVGLYEKAVEALHLLSTPPAQPPAVPAELQALLSDRLDTIFSLTQKLMETSTAIRRAQLAPPIAP